MIFGDATHWHIIDILAVLLGSQSFAAAVKMSSKRKELCNIYRRDASGMTCL